MSLLITFNRAASAEFSEATAWYESRRIGLGKEFIDEIEQLCVAASEHPLQFAIVHKDIRRVVANRFPFSVYFRVQKHCIVVLAVFHGRRDPAVWLDRA
ncbi:MAG: type II toxin-antitoxin system RelE/ParE family toxin [Chlorobium sp.]|jgi:plasmid stabilization system protein ParE|nr:type II toxin-antitoxin system RelE/ParE family toxin [Chlorobium sp.]